MRRVIIDLKHSVSFFDTLVRESCPNEEIERGSYYCGITNNLNRRASEHKASFLGHVECDSKETAIEVETLLGNNGYDIGDKAGNGAKDNSIYVYVYKKTSSTIENVSDDV